MAESKENLLGRLELLSRTNVLKGRYDRRSADRHLQVSSIIRDLVNDGSVNSYLALESYYSFLLEKVEEDQSKIDSYVKEIRDFIL